MLSLLVLPDEHFVSRLEIFLLRFAANREGIKAYIVVLRQAKFYPPRQAAAAATGSTNHALRQLQI